MAYSAFIITEVIHSAGITSGCNSFNQEQQDDLHFCYCPAIYSADRSVNAQLRKRGLLNTAIPFAAAKLIFSAQINLLKIWTKFTNNPRPCQASLIKQEYQRVFKSLANRCIPVLPFLWWVGYTLRTSFIKVTNWGHSHQYHDAYDGGSYNLDYEYDYQGIGSDAVAAVQSSQTMDDYQSAIDSINNDFMHLHAMEADYNDRTPWNQPHATDISLMKHYNVYGASSGATVVSIGQTLRHYNNGSWSGHLIVSVIICDPHQDSGIILRQHQRNSTEPPGSAFVPPTYPCDGVSCWCYFFHDIGGGKPGHRNFHMVIRETTYDNGAWMHQH
jgi:hypothetical protein